MSGEIDVQALMTEARELIEVGEAKKALKIGKQLEKLRYSGGFQVQAMAYAALGKKPKAIRVLDKGLKKTPSVWLLWQLRGSYYSDLEKYSQAFESYEQGLRTEQHDAACLNYNYAVALHRSDNINEACRRLDMAFSDPKFRETDAEVIDGCFSLLMALHIDKEQYAEALAAYERHMSQWPSNDLHAFQPRSAGVSGIESDRAHALWKLDRSDDAFAALRRAITLDKHNQDAQWLLREMRSAAGYANTVNMHILVQGSGVLFSKDPTHVAGFYTIYDVMADNEEEALAFIKEFEPESVRDSLTISKLQIGNVRNQPKGVYTTSGYIYCSEP